VSDSELVARAVEGDQAAQRALYDAHVDRLLPRPPRGGDDDLARDFTQEALSQSTGVDLPRESSFAMWLYTIAMSVALNGSARSAGCGPEKCRSTPLKR
jgi:DNA-directed RNA polymerase specialized sigma24 family protein